MHAIHPSLPSYLGELLFHHLTTHPTSLTVIQPDHPLSPLLLWHLSPPPLPNLMTCCVCTLSLERQSTQALYRYRLWKADYYHV